MSKSSAASVTPTGDTQGSTSRRSRSRPGSTVISMGVTGPQDAVQVPMSTSLIQDKTIRFSLWYPFQ